MLCRVGYLVWRRQIITNINAKTLMADLGWVVSDGAYKHVGSSRSDGAEGGEPVERDTDY